MTGVQSREVMFVIGLQCMVQWKIKSTYVLLDYYVRVNLGVSTAGIWIL